MANFLSQFVVSSSGIIDPVTDSQGLLYVVGVVLCFALGFSSGQRR